MPHSAASTRSSCCGGMWCALLRSRARIVASSGGSMSPASIEIICPSFIAAPRRWESWSATRVALAGVSRRSPILGRSPLASRRAPSATTPPATPPASFPKTPRRARRPLGIARPALLPLSSVTGVPWVFRGEVSLEGYGWREQSINPSPPAKLTEATLVLSQSLFSREGGSPGLRALSSKTPGLPRSPENRRTGEPENLPNPSALSCCTISPAAAAPHVIPAKAGISP